MAFAQRNVCSSRRSIGLAYERSTRSERRWIPPCMKRSSRSRTSPVSPEASSAFSRMATRPTTGCSEQPGWPSPSLDRRRTPRARRLRRRARSREFDRGQGFSAGQEARMARTIADMLVGTLEQIGVRHVFGLIGDSLNPLADAIRRSLIEWVGVRHEEGAALAAAGQAKLTGRLAVCAGTTGPGSTHLVAGLYEAARDHAPVLALSGDMPRQFQGTDYIQTTKPDLLFRDVALYTETISAPSQAPAVIHQAIAAAYAGRGVAHLTLPQDVIGAKAPAKVPSIATLKPRAESAANESDVGEIGRLIDGADRIVIMCGAGSHGAADELRQLSDRLKAPLIQSENG